MGLKQATRLALLRRVPSVWSASHPPDRSLSDPGRPRVLVIRPDHIGDLLLATPALRALRTALPSAHLACMVGPWSEPVVRHNPHVDQVLTCPFPPFTRRPRGAPWAPYTLLARTARLLRAGDYDLAIILRFDYWWGAMLAYFAGIPERWGYDWPEVRPFLTRAVPYEGGRHEVVQNLALVQEVCVSLGLALTPHLPLSGRGGAGGEGVTRRADGSGVEEERDGLWSRLPLEFLPAPADEALAEGWLRQHVGGRPLVALHVGAGAPVKLWGEDAFARLGDALAERWGTQVVVVGGPGEESRVAGVAARMAARPLTCGGLSLGELGALLRRCCLVVGVDSGALHLAVAVGTPTVHLYGPVDSATFGPWGSPVRHAVVTSDLPCAPCNRLDFSPAERWEHPCITSIDPERVLEVAERVRESAGARSP